MATGIVKWFNATKVISSRSSSIRFHGIVRNCDWSSQLGSMSGGCGVNACLRAIALVLLLIGSGQAGYADDTKVVVFAAASLKTALDEIATQWQTRTGKRVIPTRAEHDSWVYANRRIAESMWRIGRIRREHSNSVTLGF